MSFVFSQEACRILVDERCGFCEDPNARMSSGGMVSLPLGNDQRAGSLVAVLALVRNVHFAHGVGFAAGGALAALWVWGRQADGFNIAVLGEE